ncbi:hypothetical protein BC332_03358 [Capsicum chinense]|nr:hypothetical protein BC332_03358 [Capsicum chinense]
MIRRAEIEGSNSNVTINAWLPQASYPCANFSNTSSFEFRRINQVSFLIDAGITRARPTRKGVDGLKASATIICKEHHIGKIRADEDPMPTVFTAYENPDRHSWTKTSHDEARKMWDTGVAFRFTSRTECEGQKAIDKT